MAAVSALVKPCVVASLKKTNLVHFFKDEHVYSAATTLNPPSSNPDSPSTPYIERKLYTVNTGHATAAYYGHNKGKKYVHEVLEDKELHDIVQNTLKETAHLITSKFSECEGGEKQDAEAITFVLEQIGATGNDSGECGCVICDFIGERMLFLALVLRQFWGWSARQFYGMVGHLYLYVCCDARSPQNNR